MPSGRFFPFPLGINTRLIASGLAFISIALRSLIAILCASRVSPFGIATPSTPAVFLPVLRFVIRYTARIFTAKERFVSKSKICRIRFTSLVATALSNLCCIEKTYRSQVRIFSARNMFTSWVLRVSTILIPFDFIHSGIV